MTIIICFFVIRNSILSLASDVGKEKSFFQICGFGEIDKILDDSNTKFIPLEFENIEDESLKKALYIYIFFRDKQPMPFQLIDIIGINNIKNIPSFKLNAISYAINKDISDDEFRDMIKQYSSSKEFKLNVLKQENIYDKNKKITEKLLQDVFYNLNLSKEDFKLLFDKYKDSVKEEYIEQQVRHKMWDGEIEQIKNIKNKSKKEKTKERIDNLVENNIEINNLCSLKKKKSNYYNLEKCIKKCASLIGQDEYTDLICIGFLQKDKNKHHLIKKILKIRENPIFKPEKWLKYRLLTTRELIAEEDYENAYDVIANSGRLRGKNDFYSQQFLAGFVAYLREDFYNAILHFSKCAKKAKTGEYLAKANYWLGLSYRKKDEIEESIEAFKKAKQHPFSMYGQLAMEELDEKPEINVGNYLSNFKKNKTSLCNDVPFIFHYIEQYDKIKNIKDEDKKKKFFSENFVSYILNQKNKNKTFNALAIINDDFGTNIAKQTAFYALKYDVIYDEETFMKSTASDDGLINALIKKETNFNKNFIGTSGERGLMQIMPSTGKRVAKQMGLKFDKQKLQKDEEYNVKIGSEYLSKLLEKFDNNKVLALASYNAGIGNVIKWIEKNGDPREMQTNEEVAMWIEKIPFAFTRSYVPNILGNEMVYEVFEKQHNVEPQTDI